MRRQLNFKCLRETVEEAERLLESGYSKNGKWSLGQACFHLRLTIEKNMQGYPSWMIVLGYPLRPILRTFALPRFLAGNSPKGIPTAKMFVPPNEVDDFIEVQKLKKCIEEFLNSDEPKYAHPGFGEMSNDKFNRFHAAHSAHHFGFLQPKECAE